MRWLLATCLLLVGAVWIATVMTKEPLRRFLEQRVNAELVGYTASIGQVALHLRSFAVELREVSVVQNALPRPPVFYVPAWRTHVDWRALLSGTLVARVEFDRPQIYLTPPQIGQELADRTRVTDRGWADAVNAVYPIDIDAVRVTGGSITYFDVAPLRPLQLHDVDLDAGNIKSHPAVRGTYPSPLHLTARLLDRGRVTIDGKADFTAVPDPAVQARFALDDLSLAYLAPLLVPYSIRMQGGALAANGRLEWTAARRRVEIADVSLTSVKADWIHRARTADDEAARAKRFARAVAVTEKTPDVRLDIARARLVGGEFGFVDEAATPRYRVYVTHTALTLRGYSNASTGRAGSAAVAGRFMDSGKLTIDSRFRSGGRGPDFNLDVQLADVELRRLNDLLRAHGGFDVAAGRFAFYSELTVQNGRVNGYVKPLFTDMDVYDAKQDAQKPVLRQLYEGVVGGLATVLEDHGRDAVATKADLSGPVDDPHASTLEIVLHLLQNAFVKAILPGLDRQRIHVTGR